MDRAFSFAVVTALCAVGILGTAHRAVATGRLLRTSSCCSHGSVSRFGCNHAPAAENFRIAADTAASTAVATALCVVQLSRLQLWWQACRVRDLQPSRARRIGTPSRPRYDNKGRCAATIGGQWNCPPPAEMALVIEIPGSAAAFHDLHAPMDIVRRDRECECDGSRHHHSAKDSAQKDASHFVSFQSLSNRSSSSDRPCFSRLSANRQENLSTCSSAAVATAL